jgi:hypothetical protein
MTKTILTPTEYSALCNILEWAWTCVHQEPELCLKDINYSSKSRIVSNIKSDGAISTEYEPTGVDPIKTGECGLGLAEAFEYTLDEPNATNIHTMIRNLMYKLNVNPILANGLGNSWETLAPLVDNKEYDRLDSLDDDDKTMQTLEGYVIEDIGMKNKVARAQEHFNNVSEDGMVQVNENMWMDTSNSDIFN